MTVFMPVMSKESKISLISFIFLFSVKTGLCTGQTGTCRPFFDGNDCITVNQDRTDFKTAEEACRDRNGELLTFQHEPEEILLDILSQELYGSFWIGLRLPPGACSNLSSPLRGYKWTSGNDHSSFIPPASAWRDSDKVCSPRCVSLSNDQKWTERLCSDRADGFLCRTKHNDACQAQEVSHSHVFQSSEDCSSGPCEQICTDVKGGFKCSCSAGFIPDSKNPRQCKMHCAQQKCRVICLPDGCSCPNGFIRNGDYCEDMDECSMDGCDQECKNTYGSFVCSCREGFVLKNEVRCIKATVSGSFVVTTPEIIALIKPAANNNTLKDSSASANSFLWIWIFIVMGVVVLIFVIRFYVLKHQKHREQNSNQQSSTQIDSMECQIQPNR